jgi:ribosomal-protein-alanine N-acetyltransferase
MMPDIVTERLVARRLAAADFADLRTIQTCADAMVWMGGVRTEAESIAYLERAVAQWEEHGFGFSLLRIRATSELAGIGGVRYMDLDGVRERELGYGFLPPFWGQGFATEFTSACLAEIDRLFPGEDVIAVTSPGNNASQRVLAKAGFAAEGERIIKNESLPFFRRARV